MTRIRTRRNKDNQICNFEIRSKWASFRTIFPSMFSPVWFYQSDDCMSRWFSGCHHLIWRDYCFSRNNRSFLCGRKPCRILSSSFSNVSILFFTFRMIKKCRHVMPRVFGPPISNRASKRPWLFTRHVGGEKLSCQMKGRCMVSVNKNLLTWPYEKVLKWVWFLMLK